MKGQGSGGRSGEEWCITDLVWGNTVYGLQQVELQWRANKRQIRPAEHICSVKYHQCAD